MTKLTKKISRSKNKNEKIVRGGGWFSKQKSQKKPKITRINSPSDAIKHLERQRQKEKDNTSNSHLKKIIDLDAKDVLSLENTHRRQKLVAQLGALQNTSGSDRISSLRKSLNYATNRGNATERNQIKKQLQILLEAKGRNNKTIRERVANKFNKERQYAKVINPTTGKEELYRLPTPDPKRTLPNHSNISSSTNSSSVNSPPPLPPRKANKKTLFNNTINEGETYHSNNYPLLKT